jgi:hypothetical protein
LIAFSVPELLENPVRVNATISDIKEVKNRGKTIEHGGYIYTIVGDEGI